MKLHEALFSYLSTYAGLAALVGTKVYPSYIPQSTDVPAVVYQVISQVRSHSLSGDKGMAAPVVQINSYSTTYNSAKSVSEQVRIALQNYSGTMGTGVTVQAVLLESEYDGYEDDTKLHYVQQEYRMYFIENLS